MPKKELARVPPSNKPTRRQHFVPRWYLRNFSTAEKIYAFDKESGRSFRVGVANVGLENNFYTLPIDTADAEPIAEKALSIADAECAKTVTKVLNRIENYVHKFPNLREACKRGDGYSVLRPQDQATLAYLTVLQNARTPTRRLGMEQAEVALMAWAKDLFAGRADVDLSTLDPANRPGDEASRHVAALFSRGMADAAAAVASWSFVFHYKRSGRPLYTSDHPVVERDLSEIETEPLRFRLEGIPSDTLTSRIVQKTVFYYPLSSRVLLMIFGGSRGGWVPALNGRVLELTDGEESDAAQVYFSRRQVYCAEDDFSVVQKVLKKHPDASDPHREFGSVRPIGEYFAEIRRRQGKDGGTGS